MLNSDHTFCAFGIERRKDAALVGIIREGDLLGFSFSPSGKLPGEPSGTLVLGPWILSLANPTALELQLEIPWTLNSDTRLHAGKLDS